MREDTQIQYNDIKRTGFALQTYASDVPPAGLISNRNERPRAREGNFPFTARENAAGRVVAVKPARSLRILSISRADSIASGGRGRVRERIAERAERWTSLWGSYESYYRFVRRRGLAAGIGTFDVCRSSRRRLPERAYTEDTHKSGSGTREESSSARKRP